MNKTQDHLQDVKSSFWDYFSLIFSKGGVLLFGVLVVGLITRLLGPENYGKFSLFFMVSQFLMFGLISWTSASVIRFGKEEFIKEGRVNKVFWARTLILAVCFIFGISLVLIFRQQIANYIGFPSWIIWFIIAHFFIYSLSEFLFYVFQAIGRLKTLALTEFSEALSLFIILLFVRFFFRLSPFLFAAILVSYFVAKILIDLFFLFQLDLKIFFPIEIDKTVLKRILIFSYPLIFGVVAGYIINWADIFFVKKYLTIADVGYYSLALKFITTLNYTSLVLNVVFLPMLVSFLASNRKDLIVRYVKRIIPQISFLWLIGSFLVFTFSPFLIPLIFGVQFKVSILPVSILLIGYAITVFSVLYSPVLVAFELIKRGVVVNVSMAIFNLLLVIFFIPRFGMAGAAVSKSLAYALGGLCYFFLTNHYLKLKEYKQILLIIPPVIFFIVVLLLPGIYFFLISALLLFITMLLIAKKINLFSPEDKIIFEKIDMPEFVKKWIYKIIDKLSPAL